jgi:hypothetical protein
MYEKKWYDCVSDWMRQNPSEAASLKNFIPSETIRGWKKKDSL